MFVIICMVIFVNTWELCNNCAIMKAWSPTRAWQTSSPQKLASLQTSMYLVGFFVPDFWYREQVSFLLKQTQSISTSVSSALMIMDLYLSSAACQAWRSIRVSASSCVVFRVRFIPSDPWWWGSMLLHLSHRVTYHEASPSLQAASTDRPRIWWGLFCCQGFSGIISTAKCCDQVQCSSTVFQRWNLCCISRHSWWTYPCRQRTRHRSWHYQCLRAELTSVQNLLAVQMTCHPLWVCGQGSFHQLYKLKALEWDLLVTHFSQLSCKCSFVCLAQKAITVCQWPRYRSEWVY